MTNMMDNTDTTMPQYQQAPYATYRLQFSPEFTFQDAIDLVPYMRGLGISHCYASPLFKPRAGSSHGYDVVDYQAFNPKLGGEDSFNAFVEALHQHDMGLIMDVVPNHMGIGSDNAWWMDVLENGPGSEYAHYFDIDWHLSEETSDNKVLLPILENHYGRVLEDGKLHLSYDGYRFMLNYYEHRFPLVVDSYKDVLRHCINHLMDDDTVNTPLIEELQSIMTGLRNLPVYTTTDPAHLAERNREQRILKRRLGELHEAHPTLQIALAKTLEILNGDPEDRHSFDPMDGILSQQPYRLAFWRVATDEINYRRFFDINDMAAVRVEIPQVFEDTHGLLLRLFGEGKVNGLRIDHPDGLWNPQVYFQQLQDLYISALAAQGHDVTEHRMILDDLPSYLRQQDTNPISWPLYIAAEKILSETEPLPRDWTVSGTTGYDFMTIVNGLFVDANNERAIDSAYIRFIGEAINFRELIYSMKKKTMSNALASELNARAQQLYRIIERNRRYRGFTLNGLSFALSEIIACLDIYRTYITGPATVTERDEHYIQTAVAEAKRRNPRTPQAVFDFIEETLQLQNIMDFDEEDRRQLIEFVMKFQQVTGPVMAKSVEDTAFYIYNRLVSLNEVGGEPQQFGIELTEFHEHNLSHKRRWPRAMLATSTHDTKRSEDVRARINVLSELPDEWRDHLDRWRDINVGAKVEIDGMLSPDRNDEYLLYQTLLGVWPMEQETEVTEEFRERIVEYMLKATKEAKVHTSWINPYNDYDAATRSFITAILENQDFLNAFVPFQKRIAYFGQFNSLSQVLLKLMSPGVPDTYQGNEMWDFSLVDPDNRRPVDYDLRKWALGEIHSWVQGDRVELANKLVNTIANGYIKMYMSYCALQHHQAHLDLYERGDYFALYAKGEQSEHICAFAYKFKDKELIVTVPRLTVSLTHGEEKPPLADVWGDTILPLPHTLTGIQYLNLFTGETMVSSEHDGITGLRVDKVLGVFPVGALVRSEDDATQTTSAD